MISPWFSYSVLIRPREIITVIILLLRIRGSFWKYQICRIVLIFDFISAMLISVLVEIANRLFWCWQIGLAFINVIGLIGLACYRLHWIEMDWIAHTTTDAARYAERWLAVAIIGLWMLRLGDTRCLISFRMIRSLYVRMFLGLVSGVDLSVCSNFCQISSVQIRGKFIGWNTGF